MSAPAIAWTEHPSAAPGENRHLLHFYESGGHLARVVAEQVAEGLAHGERCLVNVRGEHFHRIAAQLERRGFAAAEAVRAQRLVFLGAESFLERILRDGLPDRGLFLRSVRSTLYDMVAGQEATGLRVFTELTDLLARRAGWRVAIGLETLWEELQPQLPFTLVCAFGMDFLREQDTPLYADLLGAHSHVMPTDSYAPGDEAYDVVLLQQRARTLEAEVQNRKLIEHRLKEALRIRDDFLSIAGHELKTPLTPLAIRLDALERALANEAPSPLADRVGAYVEVARRQVGRLNHLIDDLLDVSRIAAGRLQLDPETIDLVETVRELVAHIQSSRAKRCAAIALDLPPELLCHVDRLRFEQVLTQVLDNAIRYGAGQPIEVRMVEGDDRVRLSITDHGIGIDHEHLGRIFDRFERAVDRSYGGLGLGLYFARSVTESLGGTIRAESELGIGSTFTVELPIR